MSGTARRIRQAIADEAAGAVWVECQPISVCALCGSERRQTADGEGPERCEKCGWYETRTETPVVMGARP